MGNSVSMDLQQTMLKGKLPVRFLILYQIIFKKEGKENTGISRTAAPTSYTPLLMQ